MPSVAHLAIYQGDDYGALVEVLAGLDPAVLTGYTAQSQIRNGPADSNPTIVVEIGTEISDNIIVLSIPAAQTINLLKPQYSWDLQLTAPDGRADTILHGNVMVTLEITRGGIGLKRDADRSTVHRGAAATATVQR